MILKIKNGEIEEFSYLVKKYSRGISGYVKRKIFDLHDIDDIVQRVFISFYKAIDRFDAKKPVLPYLFEIVKNELKMYFRSHKKTLSLDEGITIIDQNNQFEPEEVKSVLAGLKKDERKSILMLYEGYTYNEIARKLNKPLNTVKTMVRRARLKLLNIKNE